MASDEPRDTLPAEPDEATAHDGDAEPDVAEDAESPATSEPGELSVRDAIDAAANDLFDLVTELDKDEPDVERADALLDRAHLALVACLDGPKCPMCAGDGLLAIEPPADPRSERCEDCKGVGKVYTGSLVPESAVRPCGKCAGAGFTERATVTPLPGNEYTPPLPPPGAQWYDVNDASTWHLPVDPAKRGQTVG